MKNWSSADKLYQNDDNWIIREKEASASFFFKKYRGEIN
jgi:hypothetical protein